MVKQQGFRLKGSASQEQLVLNWQRSSQCPLGSSYHLCALVPQEQLDHFLYPQQVLVFGG